MRATDLLMEAMLRSSVGTQTVAELDSDCLRQRAALREQLAQVEADIKALAEGPRRKRLTEAQQKLDRLEAEVEVARRERDQIAWTLDFERDNLRNERHRLQSDIAARLPVSVQILSEEIDQRLASLGFDSAGRRRAEILHQLRGKAFALADLEPTDLALSVSAVRQELQRA